RRGAARRVQDRSAHLGPCRAVGAGHLHARLPPAAAAEGDADRPPVPERRRRGAAGPGVMPITVHDLRQARLAWPTLWALAALAVLLGLGTWQMQRKAWKEGLLDAIAARVAAAPAPLEAAARRWSTGEDLEYLRATARGRYHHDKERLLYAP